MARITPPLSAPAGLTPLDIALGVAVALVWGMGFVFAKAAIAHFPPILLMALRFSVTALALVWFVRIPREQLLSLFAIAFVAAGFQYGLTFTGLKKLDAGAAALIVQLEVPFLVIIGALFLGEAPGWRKWAGIALAFVGVWYISGAPRIAAEWPSVLMVIGGAFFWAVGQAMIRRLEGIDGLTVTAWIAVMATPQLFLGSLLVERDQIAAIARAGPVVWSAVLYLGLVMTAFGYGLWNTLLRRNPVSQVAPFLLLLPLFALLGGVVFLGETPGPQTLLGGALVIGGVGFILFGRD